jgi:hypothetical protein
MDHAICINQNCFPAENIDIGLELFNDALQGVLELINESDRCMFYLDSNDGGLLELEIAEDFTYDQFLTSCDDPDLQVFLYEVEDKSPALDNLSEEQIEEMSSFSFYVLNEGVDAYPDVYALTWAVSGYLLSIATHDRWSQSAINIARADGEGAYIHEGLTLKNISNQDHGVEHYHALHDVDLDELVSPHIISKPLHSWFNAQTIENKTRIIDKLRLSRDREFQGGEPLFKTLNNGNGLREIRFSAYSGGAIRILFKPLGQQRQALLVGFIKHSDNEGYEEATLLAGKLYSALP